MIQGKALFIVNDISEKSTKTTKINRDNLMSIFQVGCGFTWINDSPDSLNLNPDWDDIKELIQFTDFSDTRYFVIGLSGHGKFTDEKGLCVVVKVAKTMTLVPVKDILDVMEGVGGRDMVKILIVCACRGELFFTKLVDVYQPLSKLSIRLEDMYSVHA